MCLRLLFLSLRPCPDIGTTTPDQELAVVRRVRRVTIGWPIARGVG